MGHTWGQQHMHAFEGTRRWQHTFQGAHFSRRTAWLTKSYAAAASIMPPPRLLPADVIWERYYMRDALLSTLLEGFWLVATHQIPSHAGLAHLARDCRDQLPSHACLAQSALARPCRDQQPCSHACLAPLTLARDQLPTHFPFGYMRLARPCVLGLRSPGQTLQRSAAQPGQANMGFFAQPGQSPQVTLQSSLAPSFGMRMEEMQPRQGSMQETQPRRSPSPTPSPRRQPRKRFLCECCEILCLDESEVENEPFDD